MRAIRGVVALAIICLMVAIAVPVGAAILGPLGDLAKDSPGTNGQGWSVSDDSVDASAETALVDIPGIVVSIAFIWAFIGILGVLAVVRRL